MMVMFPKRMPQVLRKQAPCPKMRAKIAAKSPPDPPKSTPGGSKIKPGTLRGTLLEKLFFWIAQTDYPKFFWCPKYDFGLNSGPPNHSKMKPKGEKSNVEKRHVFFIAFFMVRTWFLGGFLMIFSPPTSAQVKKNILPKTFRNTGHGDKIKGRRFLDY